MTAKRIFNDPDHPQYGPVRRMWVILTQLNMLEGAERYGKHKGLNWDQIVAARIRERPDQPEYFVQRQVLYALMEGWM